MSDLPLHRTMQDDEIDRLKAQLKEAEEKGRVLMDMCRDFKRRAAELEHLLQSQRRNNQELQRILNQGVTPYQPFILRKQAEAVEAATASHEIKSATDDSKCYSVALRDYAQRLRTQANEAERAGGEHG